MLHTPFRAWPATFCLGRLPFAKAALLALTTVFAGDLAPSAHAQNAAAIANDPARPLAYMNGQPIRTQDLIEPLLEAAGQAVLAEAVLDRQLVDAMGKRDLAVTQAMRDAEEQLLLTSLSDDADEAARLLATLRQQRGLGPVRYESLLRRNAALRALVTDQAVAREQAINALYELRHGPTVRVRLLLTDTLELARDLRQTIEAGTPFAEIAADHSIDDSASVGGLLSTMSLADPTYPANLRSQAASLAAGQLSPVMAIGNQFAVIQVVEKNPGDGTARKDVLAELTTLAKRQDERRLMDDLARQLLAQAKLVPLDPAVKNAWQPTQQP